VICDRIHVRSIDDGRSTNPASTQEAIQQVGDDSLVARPSKLRWSQLVENFGNTNTNDASDSLSPYADPEDSELVAKAKKEAIGGPEEFSWNERDLILYHLGIGADEKDLQWTFEGHDNFGAIPTFGVIPQFGASASVPLDWLPNFNPVSQ
jgi:multifunctional beta-oxidation protein